MIADLESRSSVKPGKAQLFTPQEVARELKVHVKTVHRWIHEGRLGGQKVGRGWRITAQALAAFCGLPERSDDLVAAPPASGGPVDGPSTMGGRKPFWQRFVEASEQIPEDELAAVPTDAARNLDHYLYGAPKS